MPYEQPGTDQILQDLLSRDPHRVWQGACAVIALGQNRARILPFVVHLSAIQRETAGLSMGGMLARNQRFIDFAVRTIAFHQNSRACPCALYEQSGADLLHKPRVEAEQGNIAILETVPYEQSAYIDHYLVQCLRCGRRFRVIEREHHFTWWKWTPLSK